MGENRADEAGPGEPNADWACCIEPHDVIVSTHAPSTPMPALMLGKRNPARIRYAHANRKTRPVPPRALASSLAIESPRFEDN
ncbi:MAG TPA: hypothetical protein VJT78_14045 [Candidatus Dormibacteraeota bacterium]|nr:hypothetical protein [Candidatus Dormibacteraeota bacterium]